MKSFKMIATVLSVAALCMLAVPRAAADDWNKRTTVTFSTPVEVPGVGAQVLPAGTYLFKLMDSPSDRNIVQIFNEDGTHLYTTILAIPNYRLHATDKTVMTFRERAEGQPEAIRAWFYPGATWGQEFVYNKARAVELAKITNEPVLSTPVELAAAPIESLKTAPVEAVDPKGEPVQLAQVVEAPPVTEPAPAVATEPAVEPAPAAAAAPIASENLPATGSSLPLIGMMGLICVGAGLGAGFGLKLISKKPALTAQV
jgi:hypothetical protein